MGVRDPEGFYPLDFGFHYSRRKGKHYRPAQTTGSTARRVKEAGLSKTVLPDPQKVSGYQPGVPLGGPAHPGAYLYLCHGLAAAPPDAEPFTSSPNLHLPERVLEKLALHRTVQAEIDGKKFDGLLPPTPEQLDFFKALGVPAPHHQNLHDPMMS